MITIFTLIKKPNEKDVERAMKWQACLLKEVRQHNEKYPDKYHHYLKCYFCDDFIRLEYNEILKTKNIKRWLDK
jgi:hypothetical protein